MAVYDDRKILPKLMPVGEFCRIVLGQREEETNVTKLMRNKWMPSEVVQISITDSSGEVLEQYSELWVKLTKPQRTVTSEVLARIMKERRKTRKKYIKLLL